MKSTKKHVPTPEKRTTVQRMAAVGMHQKAIALAIDVAENTLRKYYRDDIDLAYAKANTTVSEALYEKAINGDTGAMIWWEKTRQGRTDRMQTTVEAGDQLTTLLAEIGQSKLPAFDKTSHETPDPREQQVH